MPKKMYPHILRFHVPKNRFFEKAEKSLGFLHYFLWFFSKIFILAFFSNLVHFNKLLMGVVLVAYPKLGSGTSLEGVPPLVNAVVRGILGSAFFAREISKKNKAKS